MRDVKKRKSSGMLHGNVLQNLPGLKGRVKTLRQKLARGDVEYTEAADLPAMELAAGDSLTFIPLTYWLQMKSPEFCPGSEWLLKPEEAGLRQLNALYGMWLVWRAHFVRAAQSLKHRKKRVWVRTPLGESVGKSLIVDMGWTNLPRGQELFVTAAIQKDPLLQDWACMSCIVHDKKGVGYAAAVGWNAVVTDLEATVKELKRWAHDLVPSAEMGSVWEDPGDLRPFPLGVSQETLITFPYAVTRKARAGRSAKCGVVIPFPGNKFRLGKN